MKGDQLPLEDHIARHCRSSTISEDGVIQGPAFFLRQGKDDYLSVNWLERLACENREAEVRALRDIFKEKNYHLGNKARFAVLSVGRIIEYVKANRGNDLSVLHEPRDIDISHSGIYGMEEENEAIALLLCEIIEETHPAVLRK